MHTYKHIHKHKHPEIKNKFQTKVQHDLVNEYINVSSHIACRRHYVVMFLCHKMADEGLFRKRELTVLVLRLKLE